MVLPIPLYILKLGLTFHKYVDCVPEDPDSGSQDQYREYESADGVCKGVRVLRIEVDYEGCYKHPHTV